MTAETLIGILQSQNPKAEVLIGGPNSYWVINEVLIESGGTVILVAD
jgi:hypothetical protein